MIALNKSLPLSVVQFNISVVNPHWLQRGSRSIILPLFNADPVFRSAFPMRNPDPADQNQCGFGSTSTTLSLSVIFC